VTGAVGSVTGAVGSVTGNVGGNVVGSVASVTGNVGGIAGTITTLDGLDTAQDSQHAQTQADIAALNNAPAVSAATIADAVWDEAQAGHVAVGSFGVTASEIADILTDTADLQANQGNWLTATGFATHSAADVWAVATRVLTANTNLNDPTAAAVADAVWDEAIAGHVGAGSFGLQLDATVSSRMPTTHLAATAGKLDGVALADTTTTNTDMVAEAPTAGQVATAVLTTQMTESYAANGVAPTLAEAQFAIHQALMQFGISGTALTVRKLDDATTAFVVTLDSSTAPTDAKRV
jgi:hypothetical protein